MLRARSELVVNKKKKKGRERGGEVGNDDGATKKQAQIDDEHS